MAVDFNADYRRPSYDVFTNFESNLTRSNSETITQFTLRSGYMRFRADGWIFSPFVYVSRNVDLGLSLGTAAAFTAGRYVQRSNRRETLVAFGATVGKEADRWPYHRDRRRCQLCDVLLPARYPKTAVDLSVLVFPELNRWGRVRANGNARLKRELFRDFIAAITVYDTFDSQPQVAGVSRNDVGVSFSIGWTF
jgi:hypothetical protein